MKFKLGYFLVIAALLICFLYPAIIARRECGPIPREKNEVLHIYTALKAYVTEYGSVPEGDDIAIISALVGHNSRKIVFLEWSDKQRDSEGRFLDPWGSTYRIGVSDPKNPKVWSPGKNKKDEHDDPESDDICSWR